MLECIKCGDCKAKKKQIGNDWFAVVTYWYYVTLSSGALKGIVHNYLPQ